MQLENVIQKAFKGTVKVFKQKGIQVYIHESTPPVIKNGEIVSMKPLMGSKYFSFIFVLEDPTKLSTLYGLDEAFATAAHCKSMMVMRDKGHIIFQYSLDPKHWKELKYDTLAEPGLGITETGSIIKYQFDEAYPHCLIAGSTGSGKSELLRTILNFMMDTHKTDDLRIALVDPNGDYEDMDGLPHIIHPIASDESAIATMISDFHTEMLTRAATNNRTGKRLVLVLDEAQSPIVCGTKSDPNKTNLQLLGDLTRQARKYRLHVVLGTQDPNHSDLPGILKNLTYKFVGKLADPAVSGRIAGAGVRADVLEGKGDFVLVTPAQATRFQAALSEVKRNKQYLPSPFGVRAVTKDIKPQILAEYMHGLDLREAEARFGFDSALHNMYSEFTKELKFYVN